MISISEMKNKLDGFRAAHGYLFEIIIQDDGTVVLDTGLKIKNSLATINDNTELVCNVECGDHCI
jgi:hypothetical protein